jgi:hypothetical protein
MNKNFNYKKYQLLDCLDEISSTQKMIELYDESSDKISKFMFSQYRDMRKQSINEFNEITNGKKISNR